MITIPNPFHRLETMPLSRGGGEKFKETEKERKGGRGERDAHRLALTWTLLSASTPIEERKGGKA